MRIHPYLLLMFLLAACCAVAQPSNRFGRTYASELPENFKLNCNDVREHIYAGIPERLKNEFSPRGCYRFADQSAVSLGFRLASGMVYSDWPALEQYVNDVMYKVMPPELAQDKQIHAYILKNGRMNASMTGAGIMFVNVGLFDQARTEAEIAGVLAHELAHYLLQHSLEQFIKSENKEFTRVFRRTSFSRYSVQSELQADSLAIVWMDRSGYGVKGIQSAFQTMEMQSEKTLLGLQDVWELKETTHPLSSRRLAQVDSFARTHPARVGVDFLVSKEKFYTFKEVAKPEILKALLLDFDFDQCIERAFAYHLKSPSRVEVIYYLMEAIRRKCYLNADAWKEKFIIENYHDIVETPTGRKKVKMTGHIFKKPPLVLLGLTEAEFAEMEGKFYWEGDVKFETCEQAFEFFAQIGELFKEPECILSNALSINHNPELRKQLLVKYLEYNNVQNREFATHLMNGTVESSLPAKNLTLLNEIFATVRQGDEEIYIRRSQMTADRKLTPLLVDGAKAWPEKQCSDITTIQNQNINDYQVLLELQRLANFRILSKGEKTLLYILDPRYWHLMNKLQVNEIDFIDFIYYDSRKRELSLESYQEAVNTELSDYLTQVKRNRYVQGRVQSMRMMPASFMKQEYIGAELKMDFNKPATVELVDYIRYLLEEKQKLANRYDGKQH